MLENTRTSDVLFLDIETVPQQANFSALSEVEKQLWEKKARFLIKEPNDTPETVYAKAGIYAEFGKIICISVGYISTKNEQSFLNLKSFSGHTETLLLDEFCQFLKQRTTEKKNLLFCAHNGKEFDFPYLSRRLLINDMKLPNLLDLAGKKPWEVNHLDTLELWKFGDYKHYTSLELLAHIFGIKTPKDDIDGSMVADVYYNQKNLNRIVEYCQKDVLTLAQLLMKLKGDASLNTSEINYL